MNLTDKKNQCLQEISDWCIRNCSQNILLSKRYFCKGTGSDYSITMSMDGIFVRPTGKYTGTLMVTKENKSLFQQKAVGTMIVLNWNRIKSDYLDALAELQSDENYIMNFSVGDERTTSDNEVDYFSLIAENLRDYSEGEIWSSYDEILCRTEEIANAIADMLNQLYKNTVTLHTGYYDPEEDERNNEIDKCTGWYYVDIE